MCLRLIFGAVLCSVALLALACGQESDILTEDGDQAPTDFFEGGIDKPLTGELIINDLDLPADQWGSDPFTIQTFDGLAPVLRGNTLSVTVSYGGGCGEHDLALIVYDNLLESNPVRLQTTLAHDAHGDRCKAYPTETLTFDLTPIKELYQFTHQENEGSILLLLGSADGEAHEIVYSFSRMDATLLPDIRPDKRSTAQTVISDPDTATDLWGRDPYVIQTRGAAIPFIRNDALTVTVSFSGGCEVHDFTLVASDEFLVPQPVPLKVALAHDAHGDRCTGVLTETYHFDLTPIQDLYRAAFQAQTGSVVLTFSSASEEVPDIVYGF